MVLRRPREESWKDTPAPLAPLPATFAPKVQAALHAQREGKGGRGRFLRRERREVPEFSAGGGRETSSGFASAGAPAGSEAGWALLFAPRLQQRPPWESRNLV